MFMRVLYKKKKQLCQANFQGFVSPEAALNYFYLCFIITGTKINNRCETLKTRERLEQCTEAFCSSQISSGF